MSTFAESFYRANSFCELLNSEFFSRKLSRKKYSVAAFARELGIPIDTLRGLLKGRYGISSVTAEKIADRLKYSESQKQFFLDLVESRHARSKAERDRAAKRLSKIQRSFRFENIDEKNFSILDNWLYPAVLELISVSKGRTDADRISERFNISRSYAKNILVELVRLGLVSSEKDFFVRNKKFVFAQKPTGSKQIRSFHAQLIKKNLDALETNPVDSRKNLSAVFSLDSEKIEAAREWLAVAYKEFLDEFATSEKANSVYALTIGLFPLDQRK